MLVRDHTVIAEAAKSTLMSVAAEVNSQSSVPSNSDSHGSPTGSPVSFWVVMKSSLMAMCLSRPPSVRADAPMRTDNPAASSPSVFH